MFTRESERARGMQFHYVHCRYGDISETVQYRDVVPTDFNRKWYMAYGIVAMCITWRPWA